MKKRLSLFLAIAMLFAITTGGCGNKEKGLTVDTAYGPVSGKQEDGIKKYLGVPFAKPPVGDLRFAPPQPLEPWDEVLECTEFGDSALQPSNKDDGLQHDEDCLYLNIWTPEQGENLPVYVFIHGGAFVQGSPSQSLYDGTVFAKEGIVQVNLSYRLNALGFWPSKEIEEQYGSFGTVGVLDQIAGLQWVKENIAAFGGDPNNVTIGGESAGSFSVAHLIVSPLAEGLFNRGIMESGTLLGTTYLAPYCNGYKEQAYENTDNFMQSMGASNLAEMREISGQELADASGYNFDMTKQTPYYFFPIFDGYALPEDPYKAIIDGQSNDVPILVGFNKNEGSIFIPDGVTEQGYKEYVEMIFGDKAEVIMERFPVDEENTATERTRYMVKMPGFSLGSKIYADALSDRGQDVYFYNFNYSGPKLDEAGLGSPHALELYFVFDQIPEPTPEQQALTNEIRAYWINFIKTGNPNEGVPVSNTWPKYTTENKQVIILDKDIEALSIPDIENMIFFEELLYGTESAQ